MHELSPFAKNALFEAIRDNLNLAELFGSTAGGLSNMPRRSSPQRKKPARKVHLEPLQHAPHDAEEAISGLQPIED